jgi:hypothetical protein
MSATSQKGDPSLLRRIGPRALLVHLRAAIKLAGLKHAPTLHPGATFVPVHTSVSVHRCSPDGPKLFYVPCCPTAVDHVVYVCTEPQEHSRTERLSLSWCMFVSLQLPLPCRIPAHCGAPIRLDCPIMCIATSREDAFADRPIFVLYFALHFATKSTRNIPTRAATSNLVSTVP